MSTFQTIILVVCGLAVITGVIVFATATNKQRSSQQQVTMWGVVSQEDFAVVTNFLADSNEKLIINYVPVEESQMVSKLVEAIASGNGPDMVMISQDMVVQLEDKLIRIPYKTLTERQFKDTFVEEGELFLDSWGIIGMPFSVDPLLLYWNRDLFGNAGLTKAPEYWDEVPQLVPKLTKTDGTRAITQSAIALGEYDNVAHAKDVVSALLLQAGTPIIARQRGDDASKPDYYTSVLSERLGAPIVPAEAAMTFYTQFANPAVDAYSWNRALPNSTDAFVAGTLAMYVGYASELETMRLKNPNLNFDIAPLPQSRDGQAKKTFGRMYAFAIPKASQNQAVAWQAMQRLTSADSVAAYVTGRAIPPVRRDLLNSVPTDTYGAVTYLSALYARGVLDPDALRTDSVFEDMIESIISGRARMGEAISRADGTLDIILQE